jgi:CDP-glucose 4,6-dehydratase
MLERMIGRDFWAGRRVLITGHTGFKGGWLSLWLHALGADVTGFAGPPPTTPSLFAMARLAESLADERGDVRDLDAVRRAVERAAPDVVLHLAAQPVVRRAWRQPVEAFGVNVMGTVHVLEAVRRAAPGAAVVIVTSDKSYAEPDGGRRFREDDPLGGGDPYSASKAAAEIVAAAYRESLGVRAATARAGNVIGGGDWAEDRIVPDAVRAAESGRALVLRNPGAIRPWQHVLNPLSGYLRLAERLFESEDYATAWNFAPPLGAAQRPVRWIVEALGREWGIPLTTETPTGRRDGPHEASRLGLDPSRAADRLGWYERWSLERGVEATAAWYRDVWQGADARAVTLGQIEAFMDTAVAVTPTAQPGARG